MVICLNKLILTSDAALIFPDRGWSQGNFPSETMECKRNNNELWKDGVWKETSLHSLLPEGRGGGVNTKMQHSGRMWAAYLTYTNEKPVIIIYTSGQFK